MELRQGDVAVVTGGASGIGLALAQALLARGLNVAVADVEQEALDRISPEVDPARALVRKTDVSRAEDVLGLREATLEKFGRVDLVCNNAGVFTGFAPMWTLDLADWKWVLEVNLWGVIHGLHAFLPGLVEQGRGHVVNVASLAGLISLPGNAPYNASKHAVVTISESLRGELAEAGCKVGVSLVCPGSVATRIRQAERNRPDARASSAADHDHVGVGTGAISPETVAGQIIAAVENDRFYVPTHPGFEQIVGQRVNPLLKAIRDVPGAGRNAPD